MDVARAPRSRFYDGVLYGAVLDPLLGRLHDRVAEQVPPGQRVLDVGCGTGALARRLALHARSVLGLDLSPRMIAYARRNTRAEGVSFRLGDAATALRDLAPGSFDVATMVLALHEMPTQSRPAVLREVARVASRLLCLDFRAPMPRTATGLRNRLAERLAGREHFAAFGDYQRRGGMEGIARAAGLEFRHLRDLDAGTIEIGEIRAPAGA